MLTSVELKEVSVAAELSAPAAPVPPAAPPLPFTYPDKLTSGPEAKVFLMLGDRNLVLREGDTADSLYRLDTIAEDTITLVYLPLAHGKSWLREPCLDSERS
jgi:hypothetical protein